MKKSVAITMLVIFGNLLILTLGTIQIFLWGIRQPVLSFAAVTSLFIAHSIAVRLSRIRFQRQYGIPAKRYILSGVLPAAAISIIIFIMINVLMGFGINSFLLWSIDSIPIELIFSLFASGYSILFLAAQFVLTAKEKW